MNLAKLLTGSNTSVAMIVWSLIIGVFLAMAISVYNKMTVGRLVKKLLDVKANTPESAKKRTKKEKKSAFADFSFLYSQRKQIEIHFVHRIKAAGMVGQFGFS